MPSCQFHLWSKNENYLAKTYRDTIDISLYEYGPPATTGEMDRQTSVTSAGKRHSGPQRAKTPAVDGECPRPAQSGGESARVSDGRNRDAARRIAGPVPGQPKLAPGPMRTLSVRAQNVLKELAVELTGEQPPKGTWAPSRELLLALTAERLATARNCGPHTAAEIIAWAQGCGVTVKSSLQYGRSLSQMWAGLVANASAGALTSAEVIGALERSIRRKSVRIPVAFQVILVKILLSNFE